MNALKRIASFLTACCMILTVTSCSLISGEKQDTFYLSDFDWIASEIGDNDTYPPVLDFKSNDDNPGLTDKNGKAAYFDKGISLRTQDSVTYR